MRRRFGIVMWNRALITRFPERLKIMLTCSIRPFSRYKLFFCLHSNLSRKPRSRALKSKEYVIQYEAERGNLNADKRIFNP